MNHNMKNPSFFKSLCAFAAMMILLTGCSKKEQQHDATGTFEATEVTIAAKATGQLQQFLVTEGQEVAANAQVGQIDDTQLRLQRTQLESTKKQLAASRGATTSRQLDLDKQVAGLRQQIANTRREQTRYRELVADGAVPKKQLDDINYQIAVLEHQLAATQEQVRSNNASLAEQGQSINAQIEGINVQQAQIDDQIANAQVLAPIGGTVIEKYVEQGEFVTTGKPLFKMADTRQMTLRAYVTSAQLQQVRVGQKVKVMTDYGNNQGQTYDGTVTWISPKSEFTPKTIVTEDERADLVYAVKIAVANTDGGIKMGMYGKVKL